MQSNAAGGTTGMTNPFGGSAQSNPFGAAQQ